MGDDVKKKIIAATFELLKKRDMNSISIRDISKKAEVNVSAVSYYFGGKAELFSCMMEEYWSDLESLCQEILEQKRMTREDAKSFCLRFLSKEMNSTGILRSEQIMYQNYTVDDATKARIQLQFKAFTHLIRQCNPSCTQMQMQTKIVALLSALTHPAFWHEIAGDMVGNVEVFMKEYVNQLVNQL